MEDRFDRALFATVLLALALLISVSSVARFPAPLRLTSPFAGMPAVGDHGTSASRLMTLR
jgi:hypothetical protein